MEVERLKLPGGKRLEFLASALKRYNIARDDVQPKMNSKLKEIAISNNSALARLTFWFECPLSQRSLYFIKRALERNDGKLTIEGI